jgi:hypothetical protein
LKEGRGHGSLFAVCALPLCGLEFAEE